MGKGYEPSKVLPASAQDFPGLEHWLWWKGTPEEYEGTLVTGIKRFFLASAQAAKQLPAPRVRSTAHSRTALER